MKKNVKRKKSRKGKLAQSEMHQAVDVVDPHLSVDQSIANTLDFQ